MITVYRSPWVDDFPDVMIAHSETPITGHAKYTDAKSGNLKQALALVDEVVCDDFIIELAKSVAAVENLYILPVYAEEATGRNKISLAYAQLLQDVLGVGIETNVVQANRTYRTQSDGIGRLLKRVGFKGEIAKGRNYLIVDDVVTQGGTLADLKGYIETHGGNVVGVSTLSGKPHSAKLPIRKATLGQLRKQAGKELETWWQEQFDYDFAKFTESEARYLAKQIHRYGINTVRDRLIEGRLETGTYTK